MFCQHGRPDRRSGMVRSVVRIFGPIFYLVRYVVWILVRIFIWSGTWSGFWSGFFLVRYVVRNSVRKSAPGRIIRTGPDFGPDFQTDENSKKKILNESGLLIIIEKIRTNCRTGPSWELLVRSGTWSGCKKTFINCRVGRYADRSKSSQFNKNHNIPYDS